MPLRISKEQLIAVVGGASIAAHNDKLSAEGVEYDSREVRGGELFVALKGEQQHGHHYLPTAFERGAALFLVESEEAARALPEPGRAVVVGDTLKAFWQLASWWRRELDVPIVAVTGSVGKTTVKEILASILLQHSLGAYSQKSFNNHVGVPYTICRIAPTHRWAVLEIGMNHAGEIANLTRVAEPNVAVITTVAPAHIEFLGSIENIAKAKLEIVEGLPAGASLVVNGMSQPLVSAIAAHGTDFTDRFVVRYFGSEKGAQVSTLEATVGALRLPEDPSEGIGFTLTIAGASTEVTFGVPGEHNAVNAACAALAAKSLLPELTMSQLKAGLEAFKAPLQRMHFKELQRGRRILDDAYNANPASMKALLSLAADIAAQGKKVGCILGDMLELGTFSEEYHREVGQAVAGAKPAFLITVGPWSQYYREEAAKHGVRCFAAESPELAAHIALKCEFDLLFVKASRGMHLERAVSTILEREGL